MKNRKFIPQPKPLSRAEQRKISRKAGRNAVGQVQGLEEKLRDAYAFLRELQTYDLPELINLKIEAWFRNEKPW